MKLTTFGPDDYKKYSNDAVARQYLRQDIGVTVVDNGVITIVPSETPRATAYGVFDEKGNFVKESLLYHGNKHQYIPKAPEVNVPYIDSEVIYFGNVHDEFGHFLLKHMARAWAVLEKQYVNAKIVLVNNRQINPLPRFIQDFMSMLGREVIVVSETTRFKSVIVPSQTFNFYTYWAPEFIRVFEHMANMYDGKDYDKIYLSRAKLKKRAPFGERKIQKIFEKNGFHIVYPETLPLSEQISLMKNCRVLAGCGGTALHMALFMPHGGTVIQLKRNRQLKDNVAIQHAITSAKDMELVSIWTSIETVKSKWSDVMPQIIGPTQYLKQFLDANGFKYDETDMVSDPEDICEYEKQKNLYLHSWRMNKIKRRIVHFMAAFVPIRSVRVRFCRWLKRLLKMEQDA